MPGTFLSADSGLPDLKRMGDTRQQLRAVQDYLIVLLEQLRYILSNLGEENVNQASLEQFKADLTAPIHARISDAEGNLAALDLTAQGLQSQVSNNARDISTLTQTATRIQTQVTDNEGAISTITQEAGTIDQRISSSLGAFSDSTQTATGFARLVQGRLDGVYAKISETDAEIRSDVSDQFGNYSTASQTATDIQSAITNRLGSFSESVQTATGFAQTVQSKLGDYSTQAQTNSAITSAVSSLTGGMTSVLELKSDGLYLHNYSGGSTQRLNGSIKLSNGSLNLTGAITFSDLDSSTQSRINSTYTPPSYIKSTYIDSARIESPTVNAGTMNAVTFNGGEFRTTQSGGTRGFTMKIQGGGMTYYWGPNELAVGSMGYNPNSGRMELSAMTNMLFSAGISGEMAFSGAVADFSGVNEVRGLTLTFG